MEHSIKECLRFTYLTGGKGIIETVQGEKHVVQSSTIVITQNTVQAQTERGVLVEIPGHKIRHAEPAPHH